MAGEFRCRSAADQGHLILFAAYTGNGKSDRGVDQLHDHIDAVLVEPSSCYGDRNVGFVLEVGGYN